MRFSTVIKRSAPATSGKVTIGSDTMDPTVAAPTVAIVDGNQNMTATDPKFGCVHVSKLKNVDGFPLQRLAVGFIPPAKGAGYPAGNLTAECWILEETTETWLQCPANGVPAPYSVALVPFQVVYFDPPATMDWAQANANEGGKLQAFILIKTAGIGALVAGEYQFPVCSDISNPAA